MPGKTWAKEAGVVNLGDNGKVPTVCVVSFILLGRMTEVEISGRDCVKIVASASFIKCFDAPLSAFKTIDGVVIKGWATSKVLVVLFVKVLINLLFTYCLLLSGPIFQVMLRSLPPSLFCSVASLICPSAGVRHGTCVVAQSMGPTILRQVGVASFRFFELVGVGSHHIHHLLHHEHLLLNCLHGDI